MPFCASVKVFFVQVTGTAKASAHDGWQIPGPKVRHPILPQVARVSPANGWVDPLPRAFLWRKDLRAPHVVQRGVARSRQVLVCMVMRSRVSEMESATNRGSINILHAVCSAAFISAFFCSDARLNQLSSHVVGGISASTIGVVAWPCARR